MKRLLQIVAVIIYLTSLAAFADNTNPANACVQQMSLHIKGNSALFAQCKLHCRDMHAIVTFLNAHPEITNADFSANTIGRRGGVETGSFKYITHLDMRGNHIGSEGAIALANNNKLDVLLADNNKIGSDGILALAKSKSLTVLSARDSKLSQESLLELANNKSLKHLEISGDFN